MAGVLRKDAVRMFRVLLEEVKLTNAVNMNQRKSDLFTVSKIYEKATPAQQQLILDAAHEYYTLLKSTREQDELLKEYNIGQNIEQRKRIVVNARRVGLEVPAFADESEKSNPSS